MGFIVTWRRSSFAGCGSHGLEPQREPGPSLPGQVGKGYGRFFTVLLYLTIGPCFAIPRCATTSFTVGVEPLLTGNDRLWLLGFSLVFFLLVLFFSLRPSGILTWVGRVINPVFLILLSLLVIASFANPMASVPQIAPEGDYVTQPFLTGFLEGYNTMDTLAALAFGITIVQVLRQLGLRRPEDIAKGTCLSGVFSCLLMALIYALITWMGAQSRGAYPLSANGGIALADIAHHYFGRAGQLILAATVTLACLKTSIGLVTSCAETFHLLYPRIGYKAWTWIFSLFPLAISNLGLTTIISFSLPVLMFLVSPVHYPDPTEPAGRALRPGPPGIRQRYGAHPGSGSAGFPRRPARRRQKHPAPGRTAGLGQQLYSAVLLWPGLASPRRPGAHDRPGAAVARFLLT